MKRMTHAVLKSLLDDISSRDPSLLEEAENTLRNSAVVTVLLEAGCPQKYIDAMRDTLPLSYHERVYCCAVIKQHLKNESKKIPA